MSGDKSNSHIFQSLAVNLAITVFKGGAAIYTGSGALLAETIHTGADCGNQLLLLLGVKQAEKKPDADHPLGYGRSLYFWSFMVALLLFTGGGVFSIYEGIHKMIHPEDVENVWVGVAILAFSLLLEGLSTLSNIRELNKRRGAVPFFRYLSETKDSDLIVVFGENAAASLGLFFALAALGLTHVTHDGRYDAAGSLVIGLILIGVALFLAREVKSLLVGESADPNISKQAADIVVKSPELNALLNIITIQQGPGEVLVAMKVKIESRLTADQVCEAINAFERELRSRCPEVKWCFVEPDLEA
ncbi:MAG: cation diffusion facilitator family transporter [Polyangiaceae bacterium]